MRLQAWQVYLSLANTLSLSLRHGLPVSVLCSLSLTQSLTGWVIQARGMVIILRHDLCKGLALWLSHCLGVLDQCCCQVVHAGYQE